ncbi:peptidoglycan-binding domain-containing protein [Gottfriedia solisilvae]|uniref:peptidoglycan-binding domain-containing protein n=1 Tax=Gottfriedia solisilvae TaxID=1516104 RepID=UPI003D2EA7F2
MGSNGKKLIADGIDGPNTQFAVKAFQKNAGLTVDGKAGPKTKAKLFGTRPPKAQTKKQQSYTSQKVKEAEKSSAQSTYDSKDIDALLSKLVKCSTNLKKLRDIGAAGAAKLANYGRNIIAEYEDETKVFYGLVKKLSKFTDQMNAKQKTKFNQYKKYTPFPTEMELFKGS